MANTYTALYYHVVFSTKNRVEFIRADIEERVWAYLAGVARNHKITPIQIGGVEDHLHALVMAPPTLAPFEIAKYLEGDSSKWIHEEFPDLQNFGWQDGYGGVIKSATHCRFSSGGLELSSIPPAEAGGLFKPKLQSTISSENPTGGSRWIVQTQPTIRQERRLGLNDPPAPAGGMRSSHLLGRSGLNHPPAAAGGILRMQRADLSSKSWNLSRTFNHTLVMVRLPSANRIY